MAKKPTSSRVARVRPLSWKHYLLATLVCAYIRTIMLTVRLRAVHPHSLTSLPKHQPLIFCIWHNRLALCLLLYRDFVRRQKRPHRMAGLVSASRDGGMLSLILRHFGVQPVRGSSSRRGAQALLELTSWGEQGYDLAITPDGPRGPCYHIQHGVVSLAQLTGMPIVPVSYSASWKIRLRSWDRFLIPLPFSRCDLHVGDPVFVPREASDAEREEIRVRLETRMRGLTGD